MTFLNIICHNLQDLEDTIDLLSRSNFFNYHLISPSSSSSLPIDSINIQLSHLSRGLVTDGKLTKLTTYQ